MIENDIKRQPQTSIFICIHLQEQTYIGACTHVNCIHTYTHEMEKEQSHLITALRKLRYL